MKRTKAVWHNRSSLSSRREKYREGWPLTFAFFVPLVCEVYSQAPEVTFHLGGGWSLVHKVGITWQT